MTTEQKEIIFSKAKRLGDQMRWCASQKGFDKTLMSQAVTASETMYTLIESLGLISEYNEWKTN